MWPQQGQLRVEYQSGVVHTLNLPPGMGVKDNVVLRKAGGR